ncbi:sugar O-acetyltransferase [Clostridium beijerinckii]|uniref:Acetyltransferase n=1 Tax=Clostridium beijerinckii TaxID=1520 RepID=A0A1S8S092_CLOBE|nr:sugar O-acetyltransferase [Clostridium beijerinckii]NRY59550.1 maltose O-acetyltransferase [Clostridium beijerinckii]OOM58809.1 galactoside O-acetyltransferase [Clostridium beijerinckii]
MDFKEIMKQNRGYCSKHTDMPSELQLKAKELCWEYNKTGPSEKEKRSNILKELLGTCHPLTFIEPSFRCDYGFNIHTHGLAVINYNCVILDTSPVYIGANAFIAPGVCLACSGHAIFSTQRAEGIGTSKPITIEDDVWIGANSTVCGGVTIGKGSIIGAGSVVNKDIPAGVIAVGNPCRVLRKITEEDIINLTVEQGNF